MQDCDKTSKNYFQNFQSDYESEKIRFDKDFAERKAQENLNFASIQNDIDKKNQASINCNTSNNKSKNSKHKQRFVPCPTCSSRSRVKDKIAGKNYFTIPFTDFRIPRFDHLVDKIVGFDDNRREGEVCGACNGTKQIVDVTDDSEKYAEAKEKIEQNAEKIMEAESKLGLGGTRTTIIQGSDLLFVGLGFNSNKTYETIPEGAIAPSMKGGKIPQQNATKVNAVVGKQGSLAWPQQVGNYTIKCANSFNLLAGAGGITFATPGPLTFSAGMLRFTGPQLSLGCSNGPLALEGDSVNITGKAISITPTGGELFVKGNINNTGNITTQGHAHFESVSFAKASCVGITKSTSMQKANPDVLQTQPATWGTKSLASALLDLKTYTQSIPMDSKTSAFRLLSPKENQNLSDRFSNIAKLTPPVELNVTGFVLPGTSFSALIDNVSVTVQIVTPVNVNNFPHIHGIPEMMHKHEIVLPDMDYTNDSAEALRSKVLNGAHESGIPSDPTKDTTSRIAEVNRTAIEFQAAAAVEETKSIARATR